VVVAPGVLSVVGPRVLECGDDSFLLLVLGTLQKCDRVFKRSSFTIMIIHAILKDLFGFFFSMLRTAKCRVGVS
jgi:hypothetical protein